MHRRSDSGFTIGAIVGVLVGSRLHRHRQLIKPGTAVFPENNSRDGEGHLDAEGSGRRADGSSSASRGDGLPANQKQSKSIKSFAAYWIAPLLLIMAGCVWGADNIWGGGFSSGGSPPSADGGLLFFIEAPLVNRIEASIDTNIDQTGYTNTSLLNVTVNFQNAYPGLKWFIAASGQYAPSAETALGAFCPGVTPASRLGSAIICRNNPFYGSSDVTYRFADHIGAIDGRQIDKITDSFDGYIDADTVIVSGSLLGGQPGQPGSVLSTEITIPIQSPSPTQLGSDKYFAYAPIAVIDQGDFGTGPQLGNVSSMKPQAYFADSATRLPINYLDITSSSLAIDVGSSISQLSWASPPTVQADELQWRSGGQGIGEVKFTLHDPFAADRLARNSFIAGIAVSIAASALLLLIEKTIELIADRRGR